MLKTCINYLGVLLVLSVACNSNKTSEEKNTQPGPANAVKKDSAAPQPASTKNIVFFGNSLTAGYGVEPTEAFPALVQNKIDSLHLPWKVINAGLSGETTAGGNSRIDWILRQSIDIFILELGGNDGLRGIPISETSKNLQEIITKVKVKYPSAKLVLAGMQIPPNMGARYANEFREVFHSLADKNKVLLIPFILESVGGIQNLNQPDGIHPNVQGHKIVAENVWNVIKDLL